MGMLSTAFSWSEMMLAFFSSFAIDSIVLVYLKAEKDAFFFFQTRDTPRYETTKLQVRLAHLSKNLTKFCANNACLFPFV